MTPWRLCRSSLCLNQAPSTRTSFFADQNSHVRYRDTGYGQSKLAAERILVAASRQAGVPVSIVRVGQVGGSSRGDAVWADQPWISAMIRTSKTLGSFPSPVVPIDWVSVDDVATVLESVILQPGSESRLPRVFNVASEPQAWDVLVGAVGELEPAAVSETVSLPDWVQKLRELSDQGSADVTELPALRLLDFYKSLGSGRESVRYSTAYSRAVSGLGFAPLEQHLLASWLKSWDL